MSASTHMPVMCCEVLEAINPRPGGVYVDGTFGGGGHTRAILEAAPCSVIAFDRDREALKAGAAIKAAELTFVEGRFGEMEALLAARGIRSVDGVLLDLGVSSGQLDNPARGFSFRHDGPLDMRMGAAPRTAAQWLAAMDEARLARILRVYGDIKAARPLARALYAAQKKRAFTRTGELAQFAESHLPRRGKIHPATRLFQALRILVNDEIGELGLALAAAERVLHQGGRLVVIAFHSLEDRRVKQFFARRAPAKGAGVSRYAPLPPAPRPPSFIPLWSRARKASQVEIKRNPRARSARLRAGERTAHPPYPALAEIPEVAAC